MLEDFGVGSIIEVDSKEGVVIYVRKHNDKDYAIVKFKSEKAEEQLALFETVIKNGKLFFREEKDKEIISDVYLRFIIEVSEKADYSA